MHKQVRRPEVDTEGPPQSLLPSFMTGFLSEPGACHFAGLAAQGAPGILLASQPQNWDYRRSPPTQCFMSS